MKSAIVFVRKVEKLTVCDTNLFPWSNEIGFFSQLNISPHKFGFIFDQNFTSGKLVSQFQERILRSTIDWLYLSHVNMSTGSLLKTN